MRPATSPSGMVASTRSALADALPASTADIKPIRQLQRDPNGSDRFMVVEVTTSK
jgi:hypothetical protein